MPSSDITNRCMLRLAILYEFYKAEHASEPNHANIAKSAIDKMDAPWHEKAAAMRYLVDSKRVEGDTVYHGPSPYTFISRINRNGIDFVEKSLCVATFESVRGDLEEGEDLDGCSGKRRVFGRILPRIIGDGSRYAELVSELCGIAYRLDPGFAGT